uniref:Uncharacterized protein n=1 Tax=Daphnia magna TaxID=35525 RepID=A0A0P6E4B9_9CRUS
MYIPCWGTVYTSQVIPKMKFVFIFLMSVVFAVSSQQRASRPRTLVWVTPYSPTHNPVLANYQPVYEHNIQDEIPTKLTPHSFRRKHKPSIPSSYFQNEDYYSGLTSDEDRNNNENEDDQDDYPDIQSRIKWFNGFNKGFKNKGFYHDAGRFFYSSTINNPFFKTATFTITSTVTTLGSVALCVPANNLAANPAPTCAGRKKREIDDSTTGPDDNQFAIEPSETLELMPTALPSDVGLARESRVMMHTQKKTSPQRLISSKDEVVSPFEKSSEEDENSLREKRIFGGTGFAASTTLTSYSFVGATVTNTVLLDPTAGGLAACLPSGYVVCA